MAARATVATSRTFGSLSVEKIRAAVTWTLRMPWEGDSPADRDQPPGLAFHVLGDDRRLTTHYRVVL